MSTDLLNRYRDSFGLSEADIEKLSVFIATLDHYAYLSGNDFFMDCFFDDSRGIVVAHGRPRETSIYRQNITGAEVLRENEPLVFTCRELKAPLQEGDALSQENRVVLQKTDPVFSDESGRVIGVLVMEQDVTQEIEASNRLTSLGEVTAKLLHDNMLKDGMPDIQSEQLKNDVFVREINHRVKNNLQTISSIIRMQRRHCDSEEARDILSDTLSRIDSVSALYECMLMTPGDHTDCYALSRIILENFQRLHNIPEKKISVRLTGDHIFLTYEEMQAYAIILNELLQNAWRHGLKDRPEGEIEVILRSGTLYSSVSVKNPGTFTGEGENDGLGLRLCRNLIAGTLKGTLSYSSTSDTTTATVSIRMPASETLKQ